MIVAISGWRGCNLIRTPGGAAAPARDEATQEGNGAFAREGCYLAAPGIVGYCFREDWQGSMNRNVEVSSRSYCRAAWPLKLSTLSVRKTERPGLPGGIALMGILLAVALPSPAFAGEPRRAPAGPSPSSTYRAVLDQYCVVCHNQQLRTAELMLDKADVTDVRKDAEVWEKVLDKLRAGAMPPAGMPRPDQATYNSFAGYLETALDRAATAEPHPGRVAVHRLNRAEYAKVIRDLLGITNLDVESLLPADDSGYGFDNIADVLSVSPTLLERYMSAAGRVSRLALGDRTMRPNLVTYDVPQFLVQDERMSEDLPFGSRGGIAIRHDFPLDGEYTLKIRLGRGPNDRILGLAERHQLEVRLGGARIKLFTVGGEHSGKPAADAAAASDPKVAAGPKKESAPGDKYEYNADAGLEVRFEAKAGPRLVGVDFLDETTEPEGAIPSEMAGLYAVRKVIFKGAGPSVAQVTINGPYNSTGPGETPSRLRIFVCRPADAAEELPCARKIISTLARHAYRRPVTNRDLRPLLRLYESGRKTGDFEAGIGMAIEGILISPKSLFRVEHDPANLAPGTVHRISDLELASRLSFFLWSSIPDDELLDVAAAGKLRNPTILEQQVRRMLRDPRSDALIANFAGQWLYLRKVPTLAPDRVQYPNFDENLRHAFEQETQLFLESNLQEDRSVLNLLNADYTFLNERLARFYGIPNVYGNQFRRVPLAGHDERRGLLGQGSILTVTSYANRTSPTIRGKWLLENVLGTPPPPPPPNVPSLKEDDAESGKVLTMRERMEEHRKNPTCAGCHMRMDPLGFALENFDGIGEWRTTEANVPINASGELPDGVKFDGPAGLRKILLAHPDQFASTVTERLLTYALGRGVEYYDKPAIREVTRKAASCDYRWSSIILGVVESTPFQMRVTKPQDSGAVKTMMSQNRVRQGKAGAER
jgi:mono/diheme cytochrome c family protein